MRSYLKDDWWMTRAEKNVRDARQSFVADIMSLMLLESKIYNLDIPELTMENIIDRQHEMALDFHHKTIDGQRLDYFRKIRKLIRTELRIKQFNTNEEEEIEDYVTINEYVIINRIHELALVENERYSKSEGKNG